VPVALEVSGLGHRYGEATALLDVSFAARPGELVCIVGPSGCGKSTLLRAVAGLIPPTAGEVRLDGRPVRGVPSELAVVLQDYGRSLYPWLSVRGNVELPLRGRAERRERAEDALKQVGLDGQGRRYPRQLSGGMQQRVAIARALAHRPALMLLDEPFASVDAQTRADLEDLLLRVRAEHDMTVLLVTHDIDEAVYLADRVVVLSPAPATVVTVLDVNLPAARDQIGTRAAPEFVHLRTEAARLLRLGRGGVGPHRGALRSDRAQGRRAAAGVSGPPTSADE
jgi:NitT/TauT family transport system ATP-binding protein